MRVLLRAGIVVFLAAVSLSCRDPWNPVPSPRIQVTTDGGMVPCPNTGDGCGRPVKYIGPSRECEVFSCNYGKSNAYLIHVAKDDTQTLRELHALAEEDEP